MKEKRIIITSGGTGGHIFPGITIAHALIKKGWKVKWLGSNRLEKIIVPKHRIDIDILQFQRFYKKKLGHKLFFPIHIMKTFFQAKRIVQNWKPNIMLGMGNYISVFGVLSAWIYNIPIVLHEQNRVFGLANRFLSIFSRKILHGFPESVPQTLFVGNPIREEILSIPVPERRLTNRSGKIRVLVMGGSQGSNLLNQGIPEIALKLRDRATFLHQTGEREIEKVRENYSHLFKKKKYHVIPFIENIASAYRWADIVICRSGALTVSEIIAVGLPTIFIPLNFHQYINAKLLEEIGAAKIIKQEDFCLLEVGKIFLSLDRTKLLDMARRARALFRPNSTEKIVEELELIE